jgi:hypothetical protein
MGSTPGHPICQLGGVVGWDKMDAKWLDGLL